MSKSIEDLARDGRWGRDIDYLRKILEQSIFDLIPIFKKLARRPMK